MATISLENALGFYNPVVKTVQGANSKTFTNPGLNTTLTIPQLFEFHATHSPEHAVFVYADDDEQQRFIRYPEQYRAIRKAATIVSAHYNRIKGYYDSAQAGKSPNEPPVVGILATADSISYYTFKVGIMYLGLTPFPISTRNSAIAVAHLVAKTGVKQMYVSADPAMQRLAREANEILARDHGGAAAAFEVLPVPDFADMFGPGGDEDLVPMGDVSPDKTSIIIHSSGSTAFPKPIKFLDKNFRRWGSFVYYGDFDFCGVHVSAQPNPMFHVMGSLMITWNIYAGVVYAVYKPSTPPVVPTPETFLSSIIATKTTLLYCVPAFIEAWSKNPTNIEKMKTLTAMIYAGAPMNKQIGDRLASEGIALIPFYGSTELGSLVYLIQDPKKMDKSEWDYFPIAPHIDVRLIPQEGQPLIYEPVAFDSPTMSPNVFNAIIDGRPAYTTSDLLQQHPTKPHLFRVFGRADDQLMLSTGEKTNPAPLEAILTQDPNVHACLMFGRGRFQNGILIQPKEPFDSSDEVKLEVYRNKIWPSIEKVNAYAPSHSRLFKEMIMVTNPSKPLEYTAKGTPRRQVCIRAYEAEIDQLYARVEESSQVDLEPPSQWSPDSIREYVRGLVRKVMDRPALGDHDDLFQQGCDSLQTTWIRNTVIHALRSASNVSVHDVPQTFVYAHPTIAALATFLARLVAGEAVVDAEAERETGLARMRAMLEKYSAGMERRFPVKVVNGHANGSANGYANGHANRAARETVIVTGTTGRLGSHLLAQLLARSDVAHVFALNRESSGSVEKLLARSRDAFSQWGLDVSLLASGRVSFYAVDLTKPLFGLNEATYDGMRRTATQIIHNAWRVDFNVALPSFEPLVAGSRNLLDLALNSPIAGGPRVLFVSSISSMRNHAGSEPAVETIETGPEMAYGGGYPESKWVTEQLFRRAAEQTGLQTTSVRVGQVSGDQVTGGWNTTEWVAAIARVSQRLGCMPSKDEALTWVAVDVVAATLQDMVTSDQRALHLVSPKPVPWDAVFVPMAERLSLPVVPYEEWVARLEASAADARAKGGVEGHDSAHNLIHFFKSEGMGGAAVPLSTEKAVRSSKALADARPLGREDAVRFVEFWAKVGHIKL